MILKRNKESDKITIKFNLTKTPKKQHLKIPNNYGRQAFKTQGQITTEDILKSVYSLVKLPMKPLREFFFPLCVRNSGSLVAIYKPFNVINNFSIK